MNRGILVVNKESGYTSRDVVNIISKEFKTKRVGHTGTLDPLASGVLVVCIGKYTKLVNALTSLDKEYIAGIKLGVRTDTLDITGKVLEQKNVNLSKEDVIKVLASFKGLYHMEVPLYSAIKVRGKKLYQYAREGIKVELPVKDVFIYDISLLEFRDNIIKFKVKVEKGTYIRSLIRDICAKLEVIGTMNSLVRTKQGNFRLEDAYTLDDIKTGHYKILDIRDILDIKEIEVDNSLEKKVINGNKVKLDVDKEWVLFVKNKQELALYQKEKEEYKPIIIFDE